MLLESALIIIISLILDAILGEVRRFHPLAGFGNCAYVIEAKLNRDTAQHRNFFGIIALLLLIIPLTTGLIVFQWYLGNPLIVDIAILYLAIGRKSLIQHAHSLIKPLTEGDIKQARQKVSLIVSRDTPNMQQNDIIKATLETLIENSNDAIFGAIFWYILAGAPGVLVYRLVNTLDAMWGYKNKHFIDFGWAAARLDDVMNWIPARLTVLSYSLSGRSVKIFSQSFQQAKLCASPNAGPVMSAGAQALDVKLGGDAYYHGVKINKPVLGCGREANIDDIQRAIKLVNLNVIIWVSVIMCFSLLQFL